MIENEPDLGQVARDRLGQRELVPSQNEVEAETGAPEHRQPAPDVGAPQPLGVGVDVGEVANPDERRTVTIGKARQLVRHVGGEVEPPDDAGDAVAGRGEETPRLVDAVAGLHDHSSAHTDGVELSGEIVHREVAVDGRHRLRIDPRLGIGRSGPHVDVRVDVDVDAHRTCHSSSIGCHCGIARRYPFTAPVVMPDLM